jgi:hypothetical protein
MKANFGSKHDKIWWIHRGWFGFGSNLVRLDVCVGVLGVRAFVNSEKVAIKREVKIWGCDGIEHVGMDACVRKIDEYGAMRRR